MAEQESKPQLSISTEQITPTILMIRGQKAILDADLAKLYGVKTKRLNEQVKRNLKRFPADFMFQLTDQEINSLRSQFATQGKMAGKNGVGE